MCIEPRLRREFGCGATAAAAAAATTTTTILVCDGGGGGDDDDDDDDADESVPGEKLRGIPTPFQCPP